jgi:hypothetical protein
MASIGQNDCRLSSNHSTQQKARLMQQNLSVVGIDLAKRVFHVAGMDNTGQIVLRKRLTREALMPFVAQLVIRNNIILRIQTMIWEANLCLVGIM